MLTLFSYRLYLVYFILFCLCGGLGFRETKVIYGLVYIQLYIRVSVGSTRVKILGGRTR